MTKTPKRPRDPNQLAKFVIYVATSEASVENDAPRVARAKKAGSAGGAARAKVLSAQQRSEIAQTAANARWKKG